MKRLPAATLIFILTACSYVLVTERWGNDKDKKWDSAFWMIDAQGYYDYLPQLFIKHSLRYPDNSVLFVDTSSMGNFNEYFIGTPLLWSPFYGAVFLAQRISGKTIDGYSAPYKRSIHIAALFWLLIGLMCCAAVMQMLEVSARAISLSLLLIVFGTNLFYYAILFPAMSHLYSFSMLSVFLYAGMKYFRTHRKIFLVTAAAAAGISIITRATSIAILPILIPFIAGDVKKIIPQFLKPSFIFIAAPVLLSILFIQCGAWYLQTGHWLVRPYSTGGFYFLKPEIFNVLFSFRKGWFIYTPLALLALSGLPVLRRINRTLFYACLLAIAVWVYLVSCWWCWTYADSFGHRAFVDIYSLIAVLLALSFDGLPEIINERFSFIKKYFVRAVLLFFCLIFLALNIFQTWQLQNRIMISAYMDWERYKYIFLRTDDSYQNSLGGIMDLVPYSMKKPERIFYSHPDFSKPAPDWSYPPAVLLNGKPAVHFNGSEYGLELHVPSHILLNCGRYVFVKVICTRFDVKAKSSARALFVGDVLNNKNEHEAYGTFLLNNIPSVRGSELHTFHSDFIAANIAAKDSRILFYIWNQEKGDFYITDISVEILRVFQ